MKALFGKRPGCWHRTILLVAALLGLMTMTAVAEPGREEIVVIARTLGFLTPPPTGTIEIGLVYPDGSEVGRAEAYRIAAAIGSSFAVDSLTLVPRPVTVTEAERAALPVLILTQAALPQGSTLARVLAGRKILTASTDLASIEARQTVIAVRARPRIEIFVNQAVAKEAGLQFSAAFRMFVQER